LRTILAVSLILFCTLWLASWWPAGQQDQQERGTTAHAAQADVQWRRTSDGWQRRESWETQAQPGGPGGVHPLLIAALQLLVSLFALVAAAPSFLACQSVALGWPRRPRPLTQPIAPTGN
jgi:hypothetical protein